MIRGEVRVSTVVMDLSTPRLPYIGCLLPLCQRRLTYEARGILFYFMVNYDTSLSCNNWQWSRGFYCYMTDIISDDSQMRQEAPEKKTRDMTQILCYVQLLLLYSMSWRDEYLTELDVSNVTAYLVRTSPLSKALNFSSISDEGGGITSYSWHCPHSMCHTHRERGAHLLHTLLHDIQIWKYTKQQGSISTF